MARPIARCGTDETRQEVRAAGVRDQPQFAERLQEARASLAMTRSQASAKLQPAPAATPFTAAITGIGNARIVFTSGAFFSTDSPRSTACPGATARSFKSCLAQKPPRAGDHQHPRTIRRQPRQRIAQLLMHLLGERVHPFGRFRVMRATPSVVAYRMVS